MDTIFMNSENYNYELRITFNVKTRYYLDLLPPETMKLLGNTENKITKEKWWKLPHLEITEVVLVHCSIFNNNYQQDSRGLYTFVPNKLFNSLLVIYPKNHIFLKTFNSEFQETKIGFTDQNNEPLEIEDKINLT